MDLNKIISLLKESFSNGAFDFLCDLDEESLLPVSLILKIPAKTLQNICNVLPPLFKGELSLKDAVVKLLPVIVSFIFAKGIVTPSPNSDIGDKNCEKPTYSQPFDKKESANEDIPSFADSEIIYSINSYLQSDNAS